MTGLDTTLDFMAGDCAGDGFTTLLANRDQVRDDTVVRELVQNAMDASTPHGEHHAAGGGQPHSAVA